VKDLPIDAVLKAVEWRNKIVHETGRLPNISEDTIREHIDAVLKIARTLAERREDVLATPDKGKVAQELMSTGIIFWPGVWIEPWHKVVIEVTFTHSSPSKVEMESLVEKAVNTLKLRDRRFDPDRHLRMTFKGLDGLRAAMFWFGLLKEIPLTPPSTSA
ncbi:MAG TPA: hypothetical protein VJ692_10530, partial [Nitrospiraceae bacterium]|nr:hypothetical protein [Nitrospiraceae bacterium]